MVSGTAGHYVSGATNSHLPLPMATGPYRNAHQPQKAKPRGIDFAALAPACKGCGQKSGTVSFKTGLCAPCDPAAQKAPVPVKAAKVPVKAAKVPVKAAKVPRTTRPAAAPRVKSSQEPELASTPALAPGPDEQPVLLEQLRTWATRLRDLEADLVVLLEAAGVPTAAVAVAPRAAATAPRARRTRGTGQGHGKPVDEAAIIREYLDGETSPTIAARHGVLAKRIRDILDRNDVERRDDRSNASGGRNTKTIDDYDADQVRTIVDRYNGGEAMQVIAADLGCSSTLVRGVLRKAGVEVRPAAHIARATVLDDAQQAEIARRYAAGEPSLTIARDFHVRADRVREVVAAAGVSIRPRGGHLRGAVEGGPPVRDVKVWGVAQGLIPAVVRGRAPGWLIEAYAAAHPEVQLGPGRADAEVADTHDGQEAPA